jgi:hypothetical protein
LPARPIGTKTPASFSRPKLAGRFFAVATATQEKEQRATRANPNCSLNQSLVHRLPSFFAFGV